MNQAVVQQKIAENFDLSKTDANLILNFVIDSFVEEIVENGNLRIAKLGTFSVVERKEKKGRNPATGEPLIIPAKNVVKFKPWKTLREAV